jgi:Kef-type K+ transport system membrane component KefB
MKSYRNILFYVVTLLIAGLAMGYIIVQGNLLQSSKNIKSIIDSKPAMGIPFSQVLNDNIHAPLTILLLQITTILIVGRAMGWLFKKMKQPAVVGEMAAGILLGASFLGHWFPEISLFIFPPKSIGTLNLLSQIGLVLFMFIVGLELDMGLLKGKTNTAVVISHASIVAPFTLGVGLAYYTYHTYAPAGIQFVSYALFVGISMSITAFPVLARIIQERGLSKTNLGTIAITCAAADDVTAWCILALVIAVVKAGSAWSALYTILLAVAYVLFMLKVVKPLLKVSDKRMKGTHIPVSVLATYLIVLIGSAYLTDAIGIHALFGAFMAGIVMPADMRFRNFFIEKIESVALFILLPLFFVSTGLRTQINLLNTGEMWWLCLLVIVIAVVAKFGVSSLAARYTGQSWKESLQVGALMNTRGLTELVVLNIGYDLKVITPEIFTILVIMALTTTLMTGPLLDLINKIFKKESAPQGPNP